MSGRYSVFEIDLSGPKPIFLPSFDFIDVLETSGDFDLSKVQLSIEGGDPIPIDRLPIKLPSKSRYALVTWDDSITSGTLKLILGRDLFQLLRVNTSRLENINTEIYNRLPMLPILTPYPITDSTAKFYGSWATEVWSTPPSGHRWYSNDTSTPGSVEVKFYGKRFAIMLQYGPDRGIANIYVDGNLIDKVDCYDQTWYWRQKYYELDQDGEHTLKIEVANQKNENSIDYYIYIGGLYFEGDKNVNSQYFDLYYYMFYNLYNLRMLGLIDPSYTTLTTTPLSNGSSFVSSWEDRLGHGFSYIIVLVYADTDCDVYVEQSHDGSTVIRQDKLSYTANSVTGNLIKVQLMASYVRVRVVNNSGNDQTKLVVTERYSMA